MDTFVRQLPRPRGRSPRSIKVVYGGPSAILEVPHISDDGEDILYSLVRDEPTEVPFEVYERLYQQVHLVTLAPTEEEEDSEEEDSDKPSPTVTVQDEEVTDDAD
jgi:hypothetical protein